MTTYKSSNHTKAKKNKRPLSDFITLHATMTLTSLAGDGRLPTAEFFLLRLLSTTTLSTFTSSSLLRLAPIDDTVHAAD